MNKVIMMGRLARDPEINTTQSGMTIASMTIAVNRRTKEKTADFIRVKAFNKTAEFVGKYLTKGRQVLIEGRIQTGSYEKDGKKVYTTDIIADTIEFAESKPPAAQDEDINF